MRGRVRDSKDHWPVINSRHGLDDFLVEGTANRAHPDDRRGLNALDSCDEVPCWRVLVRVGAHKAVGNQRDLCGWTPRARSRRTCRLEPVLFRA